MKEIGILVVFLLAGGTYPAFADYVEPTAQEQQLYNRLLADFTKLSVQKTDVSKVLESFSSPITISFPCDSDDLNSHVTAAVKTKLAKFDNSLSHEGTTTGGIYSWKCSITSSGGKITISCENELMINSDAILASTERNQKIKQVEDLVILYHELLHGQLMIDAMNSSETWHNNVCNKTPQDNLDYSYTDANHKVITPLQTEFATQLVKNAGGEMKIEEVTPEEADSGTFTKKIGSLYDYPDYAANGIDVSARAYNIMNMKITSEKTDIVLSGTLSNTTQSGIVWLYVFENVNEEPQTKIQTIDETPKIESTEIPSWVKNNAKWWSEGTIDDSDFILGIKFLIEHNVIVIPPIAQGQSEPQEIPSWIKNNAKWWSQGAITDSDFVSGIQYLVSNGIMQVGSTVNIESIPVPSNSTSGIIQVSSGAIQLNNYWFEKTPTNQFV
ncbi:hypothetical protein [Candidatus Nitrosotenuis sp. DW1]|uniref:hypothetical protein n=1 Tax=Candidatus Nitrosotenuis sp. DW1 TaxID=2259672 RepID=UPI0015CB84A8|nr:hypothetical protein [Candidatus Nitrosotenuis sp. DW1]QLH08288.1 hypothetical protein DSQ19_01245 [Candidatus Nitrosotenuis sp. DW1]